MRKNNISKKDILANIIHENYTILMVLDRLEIRLGVGNKSIEQIANEYNIDVGAFTIILNLFTDKEYKPIVSTNFEYIPYLLKYLKNSHLYFLKVKIPLIQENIKILVEMLHDSKAEMVESFYTKYIEEVTEHIDYENETVFPFIEEIYDAYTKGRNSSTLLKEYDIGIYGDHHEDIEDVLKDLKNIFIRHLPQNETGPTRRLVLQQLFELEADLYSHTRIEDEVLIPLVKKLEHRMKAIEKVM